MPTTDMPAVCSGLAWVSDSEPGIRRQRRGRHFVYLLPNGRPVRDEAVLQRIRRLAVPPAYQDVWICTRPDGHIQATGRDARGRKQYRYHADWQAHRGQTKFDRLRAFGQVLPRLRQRVVRRLGGVGEPTRERVLATLVRLLDTKCPVPRIAAIATGRNGDDRETTSQVDTWRYQPGLAALRAPHFGPPFGFDQMARSRARPSGQIRLGICPAVRTHDHHHLVESQWQLFAGQDTRCASATTSTRAAMVPMG